MHVTAHQYGQQQLDGTTKKPNRWKIYKPNTRNLKQRMPAIHACHCRSIWPTTRWNNLQAKQMEHLQDKHSEPQAANAGNTSMPLQINKQQLDGTIYKPNRWNIYKPNAQSLKKQLPTIHVCHCRSIWPTITWNNLQANQMKHLQARRS